MNQPVETFLNFKERAKLGQVPDLAVDDRSDRILLGQLSPRISLRLLHPQRDAPFLHIDAQDCDFHFVADLHDLRRMHLALGPAHFADVHQAFDARLQLHERAVIGKAHDLSAQLLANRVALNHRRPWIGHQLLAAQGDAALFLVVLQNLDFHFFAGTHGIQRALDAAPRHIRDMQQSIDAAQIDKRAVAR